MEINSYCTKGVTFSDLTADLAAYKNRDLCMVGIVTEAQEGISKNGKNFASMVLTDFNGSLKFMLFGNDYVTFSKFCRKGLFLLVKGKVSERWGGGDLEFKPSKIELLEELAAKAESITLEVPVDKVDEAAILELENILQSNSGKTTLRFNLVDSESDTKIQMFSRTKSVTISQELKSYLQKQTEIKFSIN